MGKPSEDEMIELVRMERELESHFEEFVERELCQKLSPRPQQQENQPELKLTKEASEGNSAMQLEYTRNVLLKYLETLFAETTYDYIKNDQLRTMEGILMKEIKFSFEQTKRIESLVK